MQTYSVMSVIKKPPTSSNISIKKLACAVSWTTLSPGCRTQSIAVNARSQSPRRVTTRSRNGAGVLGLLRIPPPACGHITPQADTVCPSASTSTYSTRSTGRHDARTTWSKHTSSVLRVWINLQVLTITNLLFKFIRSWWYGDNNKSSHYL